MSADDAILRKLAKLLELSERGDEHEAQVAAQRAAELMAKHQIDAAQVIAASARPDDRPSLEEGRIDGDGDETSRIENWHKALLVSVAEACGGRAWMNGRGRYQRFMMVGPKDSVASARYIYMHLERQIGRLSRAAMRASDVGTNAWRRAYAVGMVARVRERLIEGRRTAMRAATSTALVVVDKTALAVKEAHDAKGLRTSRYGAMKRPDAHTYGYRDGDKVDLGSSDARRLGEGQKKLGGGQS